MRFIAFNLRSYDTWRMRLMLTLLSLAVLALLPGTAAASFNLEEALKETHVQYEGETDPQIDDSRNADPEVVQGGGMSLSQAIERVRRQTNGKIISAETRVQGGREVHHIKVLKDGKVRTHKIAGRSR